MSHTYSMYLRDLSASTLCTSKCRDRIGTGRQRGTCKRAKFAAQFAVEAAVVSPFLLSIELDHPTLSLMALFTTITAAGIGSKVAPQLAVSRSFISSWDNRIPASERHILQYTSTYLLPPDQRPIQMTAATPQKSDTI